jgi:predicted nucleic acid-binding protein
VKRFHWDSCVFLSFLNNEPVKGNTVRILWDNIKQNPDVIVHTSVLTVAEISFLDIERKNLSPDSEAKFDSLWTNSKINIVEAIEPIAYTARTITRNALKKGWSLKAVDSVQLATAKWVHENVEKLEGFYTFDQRLLKLDSIVGLPIIEPSISTP